MAAWHEDCRFPPCSPEMALAGGRGEGSQPAGSPLLSPLMSGAGGDTVVLEGTVGWAGCPSLLRGCSVLRLCLPASGCSVRVL